MMCTYRWATTSPARSTQPPWLQPSHCLPPLIQVGKCSNIVLPSGSLSLVLIIIHSTLQPSRWSCTLMVSWTQLPAREHWASTLTLSMVSLGFFAVVVILQLELPVLHKVFGLQSQIMNIISAWMDKYGGDHDVILVDWHNLAWFLQVNFMLHVPLFPVVVVKVSFYALPQSSK